MNTERFLKYVWSFYNIMHESVKCYSAISMFLGQSVTVYIFLRQRNIFVGSSCWIFISSWVGFVVSPVENLLQGLIPENFWKFDIFLMSWAVPIGVLRQAVFRFELKFERCCIRYAVFICFHFLDVVDNNPTLNYSSFLVFSCIFMYNAD